MSKCPNCGAPMDGNSCSYCHYTIASQQADIANSVVINNVYTSPNETSNINVNYTQKISPKNKIVALILCIFLGVFGVHRFYVGKVGTGIIYLLSYGLFGIGWFVDLISILCGSFKDSNNLILK